MPQVRSCSRRSALGALILSLPHAHALGQRSAPVFRVDVPNPTKDKPQSKLWFAHNSWWAWLPVPGGSAIWRRSSSTWQRQTELDAALAGHPGQADVWAGKSEVGAVMCDAGRLAIVRLQWNSRTGSYALAAKPVLFQLPPTAEREGPIETATITRDSLNRWWIAYNWRRQVWVRSSDPSGASWNEPAVISEVNAAVDDLCGITALPGRIGVLWSDQDHDAVYFRSRPDSAPLTTWDRPETADHGGKAADDHIHSAVGPDGTLYVATKNSIDEIGRAQLVLRVRDTNGKWTNYPYAPRTVDSEPSRPIVFLVSSPPGLCLMHSVYRKSNGRTEGSFIAWQRTHPVRIELSQPARPLIDAAGFVNDVTCCKGSPPAGEPWIVLASDRKGAVYEAQVV